MSGYQRGDIHDWCSDSIAWNDEMDLWDEQILREYYRAVQRLVLYTEDRLIDILLHEAGQGFSYDKRSVYLHLPKDME